MKKKLTVITAALLILTALAGCAAGVAPTAQNAPDAAIAEGGVAASGASPAAPAQGDPVPGSNTVSQGGNTVPGSNASTQGGAVVVTDAPSAAPAQPTAVPAVTPARTGYISESEAQGIALTHAGVAAADASFVRTKLELDDGRAEYEVEFYSGGREYDYDIDASTGAILGCDFDAEHYSPPPAQPSAAPAPSGGDYIGESAAASAALGRAGLSSADVTGLRVELDMDDGRAEYDVEFRSGGREYDCEIDALTGAILNYESELDD